MKKDIEKKNVDNKILKTRIKDIISKSKKLNLIKPLSSAFENNPVKKEAHKGNIKAY